LLDELVVSTNDSTSSSSSSTSATSTSENLESIRNKLSELRENVFDDDINMKFVSMTDDIIYMAVLMIRLMVNYKYKASQTRLRWTLFSDQMFGSGKSRFGIEFIGQVGLHSRQIEKQLKEIYKNDMEQQKYAVDVLHCLAESKTYRIEFKNLIVYGTSLPQLSQGLNIDFDILTKQFDLEKKSSYFLHIDEINDVTINVIREVRAELSNLQLILYGRGVFLHLYFSGKQTLFNVIG
jgi:hypothetical protein